MKTDRSVLRELAKIAKQRGSQRTVMMYFKNNAREFKKEMAAAATATKDSQFQKELTSIIPQRKVERYGN